MKWNYQEKKGNVKAMVGIKEFLPRGFPPEISYDMKNMIKMTTIKDLDKTIKSLAKK